MTMPCPALPQEMQHGIVVLYDGICPTCVEDRQRYQQWLGDKKVAVFWLDLNNHEEVLAYFNITKQAAIAELHLIIDGEKIIKELDAYILLFKQIHKFKALAWLIGLPIIKPLLAKYYRYRVQKRLKRTQRL